MADAQPLLVRLEDALAKQLRQLADRTGQPSESIIGDAVALHVAERTEYLDFLQAGIDDADRGDLISQDEMEVWFEARHRRAAAE